ncbi:MAG: tetratricopeptide repeat protein [Patescibacteria group bacterium]|nr:tetratricopeptide repeat protein [Patescibacteria group bacterium]
MDKTDKTMKVIFYGLVALAPVFFLAHSHNLSGMDNFNKIVLFQFCIALIFAWLAFRPLSCLRDKLSFSFLDIVLLLWLSVNMASAFFGNDFYTSFFGAYGSLAVPTLVLFLLSVWYFFVKESQGVFKLSTLIKIIVFVAGLAMLVLSVLFSSVGLGLLKPDNALFDLLRFALGTTEQLSIYLSVLVVLILGILINKPDFFNKSSEKLIAWFALFSATVLLVIFNFFPALLCLVAGLSVLLLTYLIDKFKNKNFALSKSFVWFILIFILSGFFLVFHLINPEYYPMEQRLAPRLQLDWSATKNLSQNSLKEKPLLGYGAEMFAPVNSLLREAGENEKAYWYVRFNQGSSFFFEQLIYSGLVGFSIFAIFILIIFYIIIQLIFFNKNNNYIPVLSALMVVLLIALIAYSANFVVLFFFFTFLALLAREQRCVFFAQIYYINNLPNKRNILSFVFAGVSILITISLLFNIKHAIADAYYEKDNDIDALNFSVQLNPRVYQYHLSLSEYYHAKALSAIKQLDSVESKITQGYMNKSILSARNAIKAAPYMVAPYENLAKIYRDLSQHSEDSLVFAINYFKKAIKKEPTNPVLFVELGTVYLRQGDVDSAIKALAKAGSLKKNYYQADYNLARALIGANRNEEALEILDELALARSNMDILYEQGRAYFNLKQFDQSIKKFSQVIAIEPLHANSLYSLGLSYLALGKVDEAMYYLKKTAELNPDNFNLMEKISELESSE